MDLLHKIKKSRLNKKELFIFKLLPQLSVKNNENEFSKFYIYSLFDNDLFVYSITHKVLFYNISWIHNNIWEQINTQFESDDIKKIIKMSFINYFNLTVLDIISI